MREPAVSGASRRLRIEMVLPALPRAGMETVAAALVRGLHQRGHEVGVTCILERDALGEELTAEGFRVSVVPAPGLLTNFVPGALARWIRTLRPDVIHSHNGVWLKAATAARAAGVTRIVATHHGISENEPWHASLLARLAMSRTHTVAVVTDVLRSRLLDIGVSSHKISIVPNGIDTARFRPGCRSPELRASLGIPEGRTVVGCVARFDTVKNHALLLDAFALLRARVPEALLVLVGTGPLRADLAARAAALGMKEAVQFVGEISNPSAVYREFDLFALASFTEGTSMSILEAMASGVPVVTTAVGGNPALLEAGQHGVLVPLGKPGIMADAMASVLRNSSRRDQLARSGRARVEITYSLKAMLDRYETLYGIATSRSPRSREVETCAE